MVAASPAASESRPPQISRLSRSRPSSSVPSGWPGDSGGSSRWGGSTWFGSARGSQGATSSVRATSPTPTVPMAILRSAVSVGPRSARLRVMNTRVDVRVGEVDQQVHEDEERGHEQHGALDEREVAGQDAANEERAEPGPREDRLGQHGAPQQLRSEEHTSELQSLR